MKKKMSLNMDYSDVNAMLGISSPLADFKLVLTLNKTFNLSFKRIADLKYNPDIKKDKSSFPVFHLRKPNTDTDYFVLANRGIDALLIPEFKQFDYFFLLQNSDSKDEIKKLTSIIKSIDNIQTVINIDLVKIKHINHFFNDLELHMLELENSNRKNKARNSEL